MYVCIYTLDYEYVYIHACMHIFIHTYMLECTVIYYDVL